MEATIEGKDTYYLRKNLKNAGCIWNADRKKWIVPSEKIEAITKYLKLNFEICDVKVVTGPPPHDVCGKCGTYCFGDCESN